jgi:rhodanese-related sulfurtransferase
MDFFEKYWLLLALVLWFGCKWWAAKQVVRMLPELPKDRDVVVFCASGSRSGMAKMMLKTKGYKKVHNAGTWSNLC